MKTKIFFLVLLVIGVLEIFFNFFSSIIYNKILKKKNTEISEKLDTGIKLFFVAIFFIGLIYFLVQFVQVMARLFGISLDKGILDIFK